MKKLTKITIVLGLLFSLGEVYGDSYAPSTPEAFTSPSGSYIVRMEASSKVKDAKFYWEFTTFRVFKYSNDSSIYAPVGRFDVKGHPLKIMINDAGTHIVTIDQNYGVGYGQIAAIYSMQGKLLKEWYLKDIYNVKNVFTRKGVPDFRRSTSSIYWRGDVGWNMDQRSIWIGAATTIEHKDGMMVVTYGKKFDSYIIDLDKLEMKRVPKKK